MDFGSVKKRMMKLAGSVGSMAALIRDANSPEDLAKKLEQTKAQNYDKLEEQKDQIKRVEFQLSRKKDEWGQARGGLKKIALGEMKILLKRREGVESRVEVVVRNITRQDKTLSKIEELNLAAMSGVSEDMLDDLTARLEEGFADFDAAVVAGDEMDKVTIGEEADPFTDEAAGREMAKEDADELPPELDAYFKEMEPEVE